MLLNIRISNESIAEMGYRGDISELAEDICKRGLLNPIGVIAIGDGLFFGNRRFLAVKKLGYSTIDCIITN